MQASEPFCTSNSATTTGRIISAFQLTLSNTASYDAIGQGNAAI